jgi:hypothetical protein
MVNPACARSSGASGMAWAAAMPKILMPIISTREKSLFTCFLLGYEDFFAPEIFASTFCTRETIASKMRQQRKLP